MRRPFQRSRGPAPGPGTEAAHRRILGGMVWVTLFVLLAKLAGAGKEIVVAARYGSGLVADAYGLVFNTIMLPASVCMSVLTTVLVPLEARLAADAPGARERFRREVLGAMLLLALAIAAALALLLPPLLRSSAVPAVAAVAQSMAPALALAGGLALVSTLYSVWIMAGGRYANTMLEGLPSLVLLLVLLAAPVADAGWLVGGTLGGLVLHLLALALLQRQGGRAVRPAWRLRSPAWRGLAAGLSLTLLGQGLLSSTVVIESYLAARIGEGAVATLGYANRLLGLFTGIVVLAVTRAMLPVLSAAVAERRADTPALVRTWFLRLAAVGLVLAVALHLGAEPLTRALFERGRFTPEDTQRVAEALRYAAWQLPIYLPGMALTNHAAATSRFGVLFVSSLAGFVVRPVAGLLLSGPLGVAGLMLAQVLAYAASVGALLAGLAARPAAGRA